MDPRQQARVDLAAVLRWAARLGLNEGVDNHFSVLVPGTEDRFIINPHRRHWCDMRASDLVEVDGDGNLVVGDEPPEATAFFIHWRIHTQCAHAKAILHTHMPYATALSALEGGRLEPIVQPALKFHNQIAYDDAYNGLALDSAEETAWPARWPTDASPSWLITGSSSPARRWPMRSTIFTI